MPAARIHIGARADRLLADAVRRAGGTVVDAFEADAIVWSEGSVEDLQAALHNGVGWVQLPSAGVESYVDADVIDDQRVWTSAAGAYAVTVAEHALALMLAGARRLHECARARTWRGEGALFGREVAGSHVLIVGAGGIGQQLMRLLEPLDVRVTALTRSGRDVPGAARSLPADQLDDVLGDADFLVIGAPATSATRHLIGAAQLDALPSHAVLVNIARGSLVDTDALAAGLDAGAIGAACLDVTEPEPLPDGHPLWDSERALISPHSANPDDDRRRHYADRVAENVARWAAGRDLLGVIDPAAGY